MLSKAKALLSLGLKPDNLTHTHTHRITTMFPGNNGWKWALHLSGCSLCLDSGSASFTALFCSSPYTHTHIVSHAKTHTTLLSPSHIHMESGGRHRLTPSLIGLPVHWPLRAFLPPCSHTPFQTKTISHANYVIQWRPAGLFVPLEMDAPNTLSTQTYWSDINVCVMTCGFWAVCVYEAASASVLWLDLSVLCVCGEECKLDSNRKFIYI